MTMPIISIRLYDYIVLWQKLIYDKFALDWTLRIVFDSHVIKHFRKNYFYVRLGFLLARNSLYCHLPAKLPDFWFSFMSVGRMVFSKLSILRVVLPRKFISVDALKITALSLRAKPVSMNKPSRLSSVRLYFVSTPASAQSTRISGAITSATKAMSNMRSFGRSASYAKIRLLAPSAWDELLAVASFTKTFAVILLRSTLNACSNHVYEYNAISS